MMPKPGQILSWVLLLGVVGYSLFSSQIGFPAYRDQHLGTALHMSTHGIDLENALILGFNANQKPTLQEIPLWQAGAAWMLRLGDGWVGGANLFSLACFLLGIWPIWQIAQRLVGPQGAWWCLAAYLSQPVVFYYAGCASTDGLSLSAALWSYETVRRFSRQGGWGWGFLALGWSVVAALMKAPFFMAAGIAVAAPLAWERVWFPGTWCRLVSVGIFSAAAFLAWTRYTDRWLEQAIWPLVDLRLGHNPEMVFWYFGDWAYRLDPMVWIKAAWRFGNSICGSFALGGVIVGGFCLKNNQEGRAWLLGATCTTLIFSHLVLHHSHYFLMFAPAAALALGGAISWLDQHIVPKMKIPAALSHLAIAIILAASLIQGSVGREVVLQFDPFPKKAARSLAEHTSPQDRLLIVGGGWGGNLLMLSQRDGLSLWNTELLESKGNLAKAVEFGFTKLVLIRESPLLVALQKTNPGGAEYSAKPFSDYLTPAAERFPILYQDEQLMIRQFPQPYPSRERR